MFLLYLTSNQRILFLVIITVGLIYLIAWVNRNVCRKHWTMKTLKAYNPKSKDLYCEECMKESTNPSMKCHCGWKGRLSECGSKNVTTDVPGCFKEFVAYSCPGCGQEIIQYDN